MALEERDREDLLRDGRAMPLRGETQIGGTKVFVGFRPEMQMSLYCGADPVFQFNRSGELRRVYFRGEKLAAERGGLVRLAAPKRGTRLTLASDPILDEGLGEIMATVRDWLGELSTAADSQTTEWRVVEPSHGAFLEHLRSWLARYGDSVRISDSAGV